MTHDERLAHAAASAGTCRRSGDTAGEDYWTSEAERLADQADMRH